MKNEVNWRNGFAIGDSNTKTGPLNVLFSRIMRKASIVSSLRQLSLST